MRSLFVKIFFYFLLMIIVSTIIGVILTYYGNHAFPAVAHKHFANQALREYGRNAVEIYERDGTQGLTHFAEELSEREQVYVFLFSDKGESLMTVKVSNRVGMIVKRLARRAFRSERVVFAEQLDLPWMASSLRGQSGQDYVIVVGLPERPPLSHLLKSIPPRFLGLRALVVLSVAALLCLVLARSLTSPIRKLRKATHQFADGDFSVRIGSSISGKGEISDLGEDFDFMAERIETLITSQKRLLQDISHELRSPLARLSVALELARQRSGSDAQGALDRIEKESAQLNDMIGQLLSLARLESDAGAFPVVRLELDGLVRSVVQDADFEAKGAGKSVLLTACDRAVVEGAEELLRRAIENVVRNAVKYTAEGTLVEVSLQVDDRYREARIKVRDRGPGVPQEVLHKLFEPFFRVADARDRESGGTGIGLAIADRAVRLSRGSIQAENRLEGGLDVLITLPLQ